jgi:anti-sigma B factor antagonist
MHVSLELDIADSRGIKVVFCRGRLVIGEEGEYFMRKVTSMPPEFPNIVLVLKDLHRIDSHGVGLIVDLLTRAQRVGGDVKLASVVNKDVLATLTVTKVATIFQIFDDEQAAISSFSETSEPIDGPSI